MWVEEGDVGDDGLVGRVEGSRGDSGDGGGDDDELGLLRQSRRRGDDDVDDELEPLRQSQRHGGDGVDDLEALRRLRSLWTDCTVYDRRSDGGIDLPRE